MYVMRCAEAADALHEPGGPLRQLPDDRFRIVGATTGNSVGGREEHHIGPVAYAAGMTAEPRACEPGLRRRLRLEPDGESGDSRLRPGQRPPRTARFALTVAGPVAR